MSIFSVLTTAWTEYKNLELFITDNPTASTTEYFYIGGGVAELGYDGVSPDRIQVSSDQIIIDLNGVTKISVTTGNNIQLNDLVYLTALPTYANEASAILGGLATDCVYKTSTGELRIKL